MNNLYIFVQIRWLKEEQKLVDLDLAVKQCLHYENPDMKGCLDNLNDLHTIQVTPLMLKKQPKIVTTLRKLRKYVGPKPELGNQQSDVDWASDAEKIRIKSNLIFKKFQSAFAVPEGSNFWDEFDHQVAEFKSATASMDKQKVLSMVSDPTTKKN